MIAISIFFQSKRNRLANSQSDLSFDDDEAMDDVELEGAEEEEEAEGGGEESQESLESQSQEEGGDA